MLLVLIPDQTAERNELKPSAAPPHRAISGPETDPPDAATLLNGYVRFSRLARFACYACVLAILVLSLVPGDLRPSTGFPKAFEHGVAYWIVAVVFSIAGRARWPHILGLVLLSGALEFVQFLVPGRTPSPFDFLASSTGALFGFGLWFGLSWLVLRGVPRRTPVGL